ncbi:hypothetical protein SUGI_0952190 [Cryptomeria japonica]|nr:hypothetical protein SUGI_0952190 [Cryptomeria japonica]
MSIWLREECETRLAWAAKLRKRHVCSQEPLKTEQEEEHKHNRDVFSFAVMLLELITSRRPIDTTPSFTEDNLVDWA